MDKYRVKPGQKIKLRDYDPEDKSQFSGGKKKAEPKLANSSRNWMSYKNCFTPSTSTKS